MRKNCESCKYDLLKTEICDECYNTSDAPTKWQPSAHYEPDTNADRIRAMSDEELRNFLQSRCWICETHKLCDECSLYHEEKGCLSILEWLKQPAEVKDDA